MSSRIVPKLAQKYSLVQIKAVNDSSEGVILQYNIVKPPQKLPPPQLPQVKPPIV